MAACGPKEIGSSGNTSEKTSKQKVSEEAAVLTITDMAGRTVHFAKKPERIITLTNSDMGIVYALGARLSGAKRWMPVAWNQVRR